MMDSGMIGKIVKAKRYAEERDRVSFDTFRATFKGDHNSYIVSYEGGSWRCTCGYFAQRGICSHTMAMERILGVMVTPAMMPEVAS